MGLREITDSSNVCNIIYYASQTVLANRRSPVMRRLTLILWEKSKIENLKETAGCLYRVQNLQDSSITQVPSTPFSF
jgi:hypothetical protein